MKIKISVEQPIPYAGKDAIAELSLSLDAPDEDILFAVKKLKEECNRVIDQEMAEHGIELDDEGYRKPSDHGRPMTCNRVLRSKGESYPRTCAICKFGPCTISLSNS